RGARGSGRRRSRPSAGLRGLLRERPVQGGEEAPDAAGVRAEVHAPGAGTGPGVDPGLPVLVQGDADGDVVIAVAKPGAGRGVDLAFEVVGADQRPSAEAAARQGGGGAPDAVERDGVGPAPEPGIPGVRGGDGLVAG